MKILLATPLYPPEIGGPATYTYEIATRLRDAHDVSILAFADNPQPIDRVKIYAVSKRSPLLIRLVRFFFASLARVRAADIVYVQNAVAAGLPIALACLILRRRFIVKFVGDEAWERATQRRVSSKRLEEFLAEPSRDLHTRIFMDIQRFVLRRARIVTTPSAYLRDALVHAYGLKPERVIVNYNAAEREPHLPFSAKVSPHQIAVTARLVAWKGVEGIIRATQQLLGDFPDASLIIAGDGPEEGSLKKLVQELSLEDHVSFLGHVSRAETWHMRKTSSVYVLNSTYEGLPHTVLTSFAARIPVVATNIPGTNEAVYDGKTGLLVPVGDDTALASAIHRIWSDPAFASQLTDNALKLLQEKFSWEAHIKTLETFFTSLTRDDS